MNDPKAKGGKPAGGARLADGGPLIVMPRNIMTGAVNATTLRHTRPAKPSS